MRTMGAGCTSWLSSSWSNVVRMVEGEGGWGDCSSATAVSPKLGAYPPQRRRAAINPTQKRVGLVSSSSSESQATCAWCRLAQAESSVVLPKPAGEHQHPPLERLGGLLLAQERLCYLLQMSQREGLRPSEIALAGAALAGMVGIPIHSPAWPSLQIVIEQASWAMEGIDGQLEDSGTL